MEGSVWEYGNRRMPPWKKRYCTISGTNLIISKTKDSPILSTTILVGASIKSVHHFLAGKLYAIEIATHTTFSLIAALLSEEEQNMWMSALKEASGTQMCVDTAQQSILCAQMAPLLSPSSPMVRQAARSALDEFMTFQLTNAQDIASLLESCVVRGHRLVMPTTVVLEGGSHSTVTTPVHNTLTNETSVLGKGSVLVAINEHSVASSTAGQVQLKLRQTALPMKLQFIRAQGRSGKLRVMPYRGGMGKYWRRMPKLRNAGMDKLGIDMDTWKFQDCVVDGNSFSTTILLSSVKTLLKNSKKKKNEDNTVTVQLELSSIKMVHKVLSGRERCFLLTGPNIQLLFQAADNMDLLDWMGAITHAIDISQGRIVGVESPVGPNGYLVEAQLKNLSLAMEEQVFTVPCDNTTIQSLDCLVPRLRRVRSRERSSSSSCRRRHSEERMFTTLPSPLLGNLHDLEKLVVFQHRNQFTEAIQLLRTVSLSRSESWPVLFAWAIEATSVNPVPELIAQPFILERDEAQIDKDLPRTTQWLSFSAGAQVLTKEESKIRLATLHRILHAYVNSCSLSKEQVKDGGDESGHYVQGMNGIGYVVLSALEDEEALSYHITKGVLNDLLPSIFTYNPNPIEDRLVITGQLFEGIVSRYLPDVASIFDAVGLPVFILAYKWFPTLFSDVSLTAGNHQLRFDTLMAAWDVCFIMGIEGVLTVAVSLLSAAQSHILSLPSHCLAEDVSAALNNALVKLTPEWFLDGICVVLNTCMDASLQCMRLQHLKTLRSTRSKIGAIPSRSLRVLLGESI